MYDSIEKLSNAFYKKAKKFWGKQASGILFLCKEDTTILLFKRSPKVEDPDTWGIPGGALKQLGDDFYESNQEKIKVNEKALKLNALKETKEEIGTLPKKLNIITTTDYISGSFLYKTFICNLSLKEKEKLTSKIVLNWENVDFKWFDLNNLPDELHFGISFSLDKIKEDISSSDDYGALPRPHYVAPVEKSTDNYGYMTIQEIPVINKNEW